MSPLSNNEAAALTRAERKLTEAMPALRKARRDGVRPGREVVQQIAEATAFVLALVEDRLHDNALLATLEVWIGEERAC
jgi:hypothetical protein